MNESLTGVQCGACGADVRANSRFCTKCGAEVPTEPPGAPTNPVLDEAAAGEGRRTAGTTGAVETGDSGAGRLGDPPPDTTAEADPVFVRRERLPAEQATTSPTAPGETHSQAAPEEVLAVEEGPQAQTVGRERQIVTALPEWSPEPPEFVLRRRRTS